MTRRLARNIYRASRGIQDMLQQLLDVVRGTSSGSELCSLREVIAAAWSTVAPVSRCARDRAGCGSARRPGMPHGARAHGTRVRESVRERDRSHASGGSISDSSGNWTATTSWCAWRTPGPASARRCKAACSSRLSLRARRTGWVLGLALSRQTLLDHGGEIWADEASGRA